MADSFLGDPPEALIFWPFGASQLKEPRPIGFKKRGGSSGSTPLYTDSIEAVRGIVSLDSRAEEELLPEN